ncbi:MAG TPA: LytR C-terminal domain-containing protein [bacterium]|nr:LytR C-terminal domain-containing protein [bacterium]
MLHCDHCGTELDVSGYPPGAKGKCPECGAILTVPAAPVAKPVLREVPPRREPEREPEPVVAPEPEPELEPEAETEPSAAEVADDDGEDTDAGGAPVARQSLWLGAVVLLVGLVIVAAALNYFFGGSEPAPESVALAPATDTAVLADPAAPALVTAALPTAPVTPVMPVANTVSPVAPTAAAAAPPVAPRPAVTAPTTAPRPSVTAPPVTPRPATTTPATTPAAASRNSGVITVKILNASGRDGLAAEVERKLEAANPNIRVISVGTHEGASVETVVYDKHYRMEATQTVQRTLGRGRVTQNPDNRNQYEYDVLVVLGTDYPR